NGEALGHEKPHPDGRIEIRAGNAAERAHGNGKRQPVRERDADAPRARSNRRRRTQNRGDAGEAEIERSQELGDERLNFHGAILSRPYSRKAAQTFRRAAFYRSEEPRPSPLTPCAFS